MKITDIKAYVLENVAAKPRFRWRNGLPGGGDGTPPGGKTCRTLIRVETDAGLNGMAEAPSIVNAADLVYRRFKKFVGWDPMLTEKLWEQIWEIDRIEEMHLLALGLLDLACWDIKSRAAGLPVYQLLGGYEPRVPAYASTVTWETMKEYEYHVKECMNAGFKAFKLHAWGDAKADAQLCRNLRKWTGDEADLMYDGSAAWDYVTALRFGRVLEDLDFLWYEEPMREFSLPSYKKLCDNLDIPVLAAETNEGAHWNASTWIHFGALDMVRTSAYFKGGITGAVKVAHLAESFGMRAQVHGVGHANLHLCAALPNNDYYEQNIIDSQDIRSLKKRGATSVKDGYLMVPDEPGLAPHPDWERLEKEAVRIV